MASAVARPTTSICSSAARPTPSPRRPTRSRPRVGTEAGRSSGSATRRRSGASFVHTERAQLLVDLAIDSPPLGRPTITAYGPTHPPQELAARKILALYDRAAARDFVDAYALSTQFDLAQLLRLAAELDEGLEPAVLAEMLATLDRYTDDELAELGAEPDALRAFTHQWRDQLTTPKP